MKEIISLCAVGKRYRLYQNPRQRLTEVFRFQETSARDFWALQEVSFEVTRGEAVGVIGRNGSGKSTLLQIVAGVLRPTTGQLFVNGRVSALLELGTGFNPEYTGRSNVYLNLALGGLTRTEIDARMEQVEAFAEIGAFIDQPVKHYSTGMFLRLAFACAVSVEPDVLLVDEALAVGDVFFSQKCFARIREIIASGCTCLFVSHDTSAILNVCSRVIVLDGGRITFDGAPEEAVSRYFGSGTPRGRVSSSFGSYVATQPTTVGMFSAEQVQAGDILASARARHGPGGLKVAALRVTDSGGADTLEVAMLGRLYFHVLLQAEELIRDPSTGIMLFDRLGNIVFAAGTRQHGIRLPDLSVGQQVVVKLALTFSVSPGQYTFAVGAGEPSDEGPNVGYLQDRHDMLGPILVTADMTKAAPFFGIAQLPMEISVAAVTAASRTVLS
jgi:lipopolysaccharide transport system ATP-binding protein